MRSTAARIPRSLDAEARDNLFTLHQRTRRLKWDRDWRVESARPESDLSTVVPEELVEAVSSGWFRPGSSVVDLGSGRGQISAWLAERGFRVLGVDLSEEATQLSRRHFGAGAGAPEFRTVDLCEEPLETVRFDALVDRGCFHGVPQTLKKAYVRNIANCCKPGAPLLLLHKMRHHEAEVVEQVSALFGPYFRVERHAPTRQEMARSAGPLPRRRVPGRAFWLVRTDSPVV